MIPDLGKYALEVLSAYVVSLVLLIGLIWISLRAGRKARAALKDIEARREGSGQ